LVQPLVVVIAQDSGTPAEGSLHQGGDAVTDRHRGISRSYETRFERIKKGPHAIAVKSGLPLRRLYAAIEIVRVINNAGPRARCYQRDRAMKLEGMQVIELGRRDTPARTPAMAPPIPAAETKIEGELAATSQPATARHRDSAVAGASPGPRAQGADFDGVSPKPVRTRPALDHDRTPARLAEARRNAEGPAISLERQRCK